jgi:hypothetical protein
VHAWAPALSALGAEPLPLIPDRFMYVRDPPRRPIVKAVLAEIRSRLKAELATNSKTLTFVGSRAPSGVGVVRADGCRLP